MIQRIQSVWLAVGVLCGTMGMVLPLGVTIATAPNVGLIIHNDFISMSLQFFGTVGAIATIFQFKNRRLQMKIAKIVGGVFLAAFSWEIWKVVVQTHGMASVKPGLFLTTLAGACCLMASRAIQKDEALVKSIDRLR